MKTYASLFSGFGGADIGAKAAGLQLAWGVEYDAKIAEVANYNLGQHIKVANLLDCDPMDFERVDVLHASPPCFPAGVQVLTDKGHKDISDIAIGDTVLTHLGRWKTVTNVVTKKSSTIILDGLGHWGLEVTPDHPFLSVKSYNTYPPYKERKSGNFVQHHISEASWTNASEMLGKQWLSLTEYPYQAPPEMEYSHHEALRGQRFDFDSLPFWWIVGAWVGDGWVRYSEGQGHLRNRGTVYICAANYQADALQIRLDEAGIKYNRSQERTTTRFSIESRPFARWLTDNFGKYAHGKTIPGWMLGQCEGVRTAFLQGFVFADGHTSHPPTFDYPVISISTVSPKLAIGLRIIGLTLGYSATVKMYERTRENGTIEGRTVNERPSYTIRLSTSERYSKIISHNDVSYRSGLVRKIELGQDEVDVYVITVDEDESFIADGIVVHNCPSFSAAKTNGVETALDLALAGKVAEFVKVLQPETLTLENVFAYRNSKSWRLIEDTLYKNGYWLHIDHVNAADYQVPQTRKRMIVRAIRGGFVPYLPQPEPWIGWYQAVEDLIPTLPDSQFAPWQLARLPEELKNIFLITSQYDKPSNCEDRKAQKIDSDKPSATVTSSNHGDWRAFIVEGSAAGEDNKFTMPVRMSDEPVFTMRATQNNPRAFIVSGGNTYTPVLTDENPCFTLTSSSSSSSSHRAQLKTGRVVSMTPQCLARFQSFPDAYILPESKALASKGIGNAVAPLMYQKVISGLVNA